MALRISAASLHARAPRTVLVPLNLFGLAPRITALGHEWRVKDELHVTAVDAVWLAAGLRRDPGEVWAAVASAIEDRRAGTIRLGADLRVAEEEGERTLLVMARVDGLDALYEELSARLGAPLAVPPAHVTLYTRPGGAAIGVHDDGELRKLTRRLGADEAADVAAAAGLGALLAC